MVSANDDVDDDLDDWEELMPDSGESRLSAVYDAFDLALYADPDEFTLRQGLIGAYFLIFIPMVVGSVLMITVRIASGELTVDGIIAAVETARATSTGSGDPFSSIDYTELGKQFLFNGLLIPTCLGVSLLVKTAIKALARWSG